MCLAVGAWYRTSTAQQQAAQRFLNALCRQAAPDRTGEVSLIDLPALPSGNPWHRSAMEVKDALSESAERAQAAEHSRTSVEVRAQRARQESEHVNTILDGLPEPVLVIDNFDDVILANPSAERLFGFRLEECSAPTLSKLVQEPTVFELLTETRKRKTPTARSAEIQLPDGNEELHWYSVTVTSLLCSGGSEGQLSRGAVAVLRDISAHKAAQKRNAEFVSAVSHEMKTPLAGIKAYVELLADGDAEDEETREEFLEVINLQTDRLQRLIDNLLNLARIEAGVVEVSKEARSLNELLERAFAVVQPSAEAKNITLENDLSPMYLGVLVDRDMIMQAAINLLSNAIKYTPQGGQVTLRSRTKDDRVQFEVEDSGVGLSEEDCQRVFQKFYRVRKDSGMAQGTGLGLPLAKHIVEDVHGGELAVKSELGKGSIFRITLPTAGQLVSACPAS